MKIRKVVIGDFESILNLSLQLEEVEIPFDDNLKEKCYATHKGKEKLKKRISDENNIFYVATNDKNDIIGFIDGKISEDEWWYKDTVAYLDHICVDKNYRSGGVGAALLKKFEETIKACGVKYIRLLAFPQNIHAISFYTKNGFTEYSKYYNKKL